MDKVPYFDILVKSDQEGYLELKTSLSSEKRRYQRFHRTDSFEEIITEIKKFCIRNDCDDWKRCLVCGICWPQGCIGINVRQLALLIDKSKSNINGVFAKMGYVSDQGNIEFKRSLVEFLPILRGNHLEQRFWTIRYNPAMTPIAEYSRQCSSPEDINKSNEVDMITHQSYTPEPMVREVDIPAKESLQDIFDKYEMKIRTDHECGTNCQLFNFFSDATCCCPHEWFGPSSSTENFFSFC